MFNPAPRKGWQPHKRIELPLNLLFPGTALVHAGYKVKIVDQYADPDWAEKLNHALREKPLCFGVSSMTGPQIFRALDACKKVRNKYPDVPIIWGGIHASLLPQQTLENPFVDIVVIGEGEASLVELVRTLESGGELGGIKGIAYREKGKCRVNEERPFIDMNQLPTLDYELVNIDLYRRKIFGSDHLTLNTSRGCLNRCGFCYESAINKRKWRAMEPRVVIEHIRKLVIDYGVRGFNFTDDNLFSNLNHAYSLLEEIVRSDVGIRIGRLEVRADAVARMNEDFLDLFVRAGVERVAIGVESGNQRILDLIDKGLNRDQILEASRKLKHYPITPLYMFMMGLPTETPEEIKDSVDLAQDLMKDNPRAMQSFNIYMPFPGTRIFQMTVESGYKAPEKLEDWAPLSYRHIHKHSPWISRETKRLIEALDFPLMFTGTGKFTNKKTHPIVRLMGKLYKPFAEYRTTHMDPRFPVETRIVKGLGLFGRED